MIELAHDFLPKIKNWLLARNVKNSFDTWHGKQNSNVQKYFHAKLSFGVKGVNIDRNVFRNCLGTGGKFANHWCNYVTALL